MPAKFTIKQIRLLKCNYSYNESYKENENTDDTENDEKLVNLKLDCSSKYFNESNVLRVSIAVKCEDISMPYSLYVQMGGIFQFESEPNENELEKLSKINCPAMLLPYLREFVSDLVRRGGDDALYLPPVNFVGKNKELLSEEELNKIEAEYQK